jgi:hypothetical protein
VKLRVISELFLQNAANIHDYFFCSSVSRRSTNFAATDFIITSSIKMPWHEFYDTFVISESLSMVQQQSARTAWRTFSTFSSVLLKVRSYNADGVQQTFQLA